MKLSLVVMTPGNKMEGKVLEIKLAQFVIGRDPQCHLRPASALISKRHCALLQRDGKVFVRDFGSTNGTFVNEVPVKGEVELHADDKLKIGPLQFSVRIEQEAPAAKKSLTPPPPTRPSTRTVKQAAPTAEAAGETAPSAAAATAATAATTGATTSANEETADSWLSSTSSTSNHSSSDEDVAAMLLSLQDEGGNSQDGVPEGSTVHDLSVSADALAGTDQNPAAVDAKKKEEARKKAIADANTAAAAEAILKKYSRRSRKE